MKTTLVAVALIVINLAVYAPVRNYGFIAFDDTLYITENQNISGGLTWQSCWWALTTGRAGYWIPLTWLSHILDVELYGLAAGPQHVTNALLHIVNTLLLFGVLRRMTGGLWPSAFVSALFAIHPLHVESVAWVAERKDVLSAFFFMLALWAYSAYVRRPGLKRYVAVILAFALGLMAKPMVVTLPLVLILLDIWPLRRVRIERGQLGVWSRLMAEKLPLCALAIASSVVTVVFTSQRGAIGGLDVFPWSVRVANALAAYAAYIGDMVWPAGLAPFYPYELLSGMRVAVSALVLIGICGCVVLKARTHPYLLVGWLWYLLTLLPVAGLIQAGMQSRADRFTYIPLVGLFIMVAWGLPHVAARWRRRAIGLAAAAAILISALTITARHQVHYWEGRLTLWRHALDVTNGNYVAFNIVGMALVDAGKVDEGMSHYRQALSIRPDYGDAHNNLGIALARQQRTDEAISEFKAAVSVGRSNPEMYYNLGFALAQQGKLDEAIAQYSEAIRIDPAHVAAHTKFGDALFLQGKVNAAAARYTHALRIQPGYAVAHNNLGVALTNLERYDDAISHYTIALRMLPDFADAHNGIGAALAKQRRYGEAIGHFTQALRIQPGNVTARDNLERALAIQMSTP